MKRASSRLFRFFRRRSSHCFSDALSGLLAFFLLLTSPHTALLLPSNGCHSPSKHPECNWSCFLAAVPLGPAFLRPSHCSAAFLPCAQLAGAWYNVRAPARLRGCLTAVTTPLSGRDVTSAGKDVTQHRICENTRGLWMEWISMNGAQWQKEHPGHLFKLKLEMSEIKKNFSRVFVFWI